MIQQCLGEDLGTGGRAVTLLATQVQHADMFGTVLQEEEEVMEEEEEEGEALQGITTA